jgi:hypothetical protein
MSAKLRALAANFPRAVAKAMYQEMQVELTEMKRRTPVDTGMLKSSGIVLPPEEGKKIRVQVVFGGMAAPYAIYVHEDLEAFHKIGQAKFVESVINESVPYMTQRIFARVDLSRLIR